MERAARNYLGDEVEAISRDELRKRLRRSEVVLVDVREESEWENGRIPGSVHVPLSQIRNRGSRVLPESRELVLVCRSGARSALAAAMLAEDDALDAANLAGGVQAWIREGLPFEATFE